MAVVMLTARWFGIWPVTLLGFGGLLTIAILQTRFSTRHYLWTLLTTECPQCGSVPMIYKSSTDNNDRRGFLICGKCQIEWDLGRSLASLPGRTHDLTSLAASISDIIDKQIQNNDPPETGQTYKRLQKEGQSSDEARRLISTAALVETFHIVSDRKPFKRERYVWNLTRLPQKPWDAQRKELYRS